MNTLGWQHFQWYRCQGCGHLYMGGTTTSGYATCQKTGDYVFQEPVSFTLDRGFHIADTDPPIEKPAP